MLEIFNSFSPAACVSECPRCFPSLYKLIIGVGLCDIISVSFSVYLVAGSVTAVCWPVLDRYFNLLTELSLSSCAQ